jgi:lactate dehydrogenase-like 2-hydroxyacid dehydrogenase
MRGISKGANYVRAGRWTRDGNLPLATSCQHKVAGIIGLGRIGGAVAKRLGACGMRVLYYGRNRQPQMPYTYCGDLSEMARASDVLVICCPSTPATIGLVDTNILRELGPEGFLINVARGNVVDEVALIEALERRVIGGAGLDVCNDEPNPQPSLVALDNVIILPHLGAATVETRDAMFDVMVTKLRCHFAGSALPDPYRVS